MLNHFNTFKEIDNLANCHVGLILGFLVHFLHPSASNVGDGANYDLFDFVFGDAQVEVEWRQFQNFFLVVL